MTAISVAHHRNWSGRNEALTPIEGGRKAVDNARDRSSMARAATPPGRRACPEKRAVMYARTTTISADPQRLHEGVADVRDNVMPAVAEMPGYT